MSRTCLKGQERLCVFGPATAFERAKRRTVILPLVGRTQRSARVERDLKRFYFNERQFVSDSVTLGPTHEG